jgi:hypothetical protein
MKRIVFKGVTFDASLRITRREDLSSAEFPAYD